MRPGTPATLPGNPIAGQLDWPSELATRRAGQQRARVRPPGLCPGSSAWSWGHGRGVRSCLLRTDHLPRRKMQEERPDPKYARPMARVRQPRLSWARTRWRWAPTARCTWATARQCARSAPTALSTRWRVTRPIHRGNSAELHLTFPKGRQNTGCMHSHAACQTRRTPPPCRRFSPTRSIRRRQQRRVRPALAQRRINAFRWASEPVHP